MVHRDFKPENVLVDRRGTARVLDFGLARLQGDAENVVAAEAPEAALAALQPALRTPVSQPGALSGTPGYMSPEQYLCRPADSRSDQFSFCVALFEALFGFLPFGGDSLADMAAAVSTGQLRSIPPATTVPIEIQRALFRGLSTDPAERFASMEDLLHALAIDSERDPAGAKRGRVFVSALIVGATLILALSILTRGLSSHFSMRSFAGVMGGVSLMFALAMIVYRRTLLGNAFHRGLVTMSFCGVLSILGARLMAWAAGVPIESYLPLDLMHFCCLGSAIAVCYLPRLWLLMPALFASALAALHWPAHCFEIANVSYTLLPLFFIASWSDVASRSTATQPKDVASLLQ